MIDEREKCKSCKLLWTDHVGVQGTCAALQAERKKVRELAAALWCAEDQWGDEYLWQKWGLSKLLTDELKSELEGKGKS